MTSVRSLSAAGARYVIVPNQPQSFGTATERTLRTTYNQTLWSGLAANNVNFIPVDFNGMLQAVTGNLA